MANFNPTENLPDGAVLTGMVCGMEYIDPETGEPLVATYIDEETAWTTANALAHIVSGDVHRLATEDGD